MTNTEILTYNLFYIIVIGHYLRIYLSEKFAWKFWIYLTQCIL